MKKFKLCINIKYLLLVIALYGFVLENFVELNFAGWFGYIDEVMALVFGIIFLYYLRTGKCREYYIKVGSSRKKVGRTKDTRFKDFTI